MSEAEIAEVYFTDAQIRNLIEDIDSFHGNELKDREPSHIQKEINVIKAYLSFCLGGHDGEPKGKQ